MMNLSFPPGVVTGTNVQEIFKLAKNKKFAIKISIIIETFERYGNDSKRKT